MPCPALCAREKTREKGKAGILPASFLVIRGGRQRRMTGAGNLRSAQTLARASAWTSSMASPIRLLITPKASWFAFSTSSFSSCTWLRVA
jgi:hypothetical protein